MVSVANPVAKSANPEPVNAKFNYGWASPDGSLAVLKSMIMKWQAIHQEILLITESSLSSRHLCKKNNSNNKYSPIEELEQACWDGLLDELLPGIMECPSSNGMSFIWKIESTKKFLHINMGTCPSYIEYETSLDPYFFLEIVILN